jgi:chemotaxis response regulator CheB
MRRRYALVVMAASAGGVPAFQKVLGVMNGRKIRHVHSSANPLFESAAEDEESSHTFGMPHSAILTGAVQAILPLNDIAGELRRLAKVPA